MALWIAGNDLGEGNFGEQLGKPADFRRWRFRSEGLPSRYISSFGARIVCGRGNKPFRDLGKEFLGVTDRQPVFFHSA